MSEDPGAIYFTGTAGAGKTSLVVAFRAWLKSAGYDPLVINLDPGSESPELEPDIDIREWVRLPEVMAEYNLGPNGAQVAAADMIALKVLDVKQALTELRADIILIDTPGQIELFGFREASRTIVEALTGDRSMIAFLFDPGLAKSASGFVSLLLLSATIEFRFRLPTVNLLAKTDLLTDAQRDEVTGWAEDPSQLIEAVSAENPTPDVQLSTEMARAIEALAPLAALFPTSSKQSTGLEQLYRTAQLNFAGGEDLEVSQEAVDE